MSNNQPELLRLDTLHHFPGPVVELFTVVFVHLQAQLLDAFDQLVVAAQVAQQIACCLLCRCKEIINIANVIFFSVLINLEIRQ